VSPTLKRDGSPASIDEALADAMADPTRRKHGRLRMGPLHGACRSTTKVNTDQKGCPTNRPSRAVRNLIATEDSPW